ncbi:hypothetical protein IFR04_001623 [Cadophora malorum]|uniref:Uncharacterized protein n=1 Tax=Cadophora malorum TaxID=108018 RepID=A0A8H8BV84_9HELO|nr:hypothetical protein IFR04_001623 [Cadophora malorum]
MQPAVFKIQRPINNINSTAHNLFAVILHAKVNNTDFLAALKECLTGSSNNTSQAYTAVSSSQASGIRLPLAPSHPADTELAQSLLTGLLTSSQSTQSLGAQLSSQLTTQDFTSHLAPPLLDGLIHALNTSATIDSTMKEAFDKASGVAEEFAKEHPVLVAVMATLVAGHPDAGYALGYCGFGVRCFGAGP